MCSQDLVATVIPLQLHGARVSSPPISSLPPVGGSDEGEVAVGTHC